MKIFFFILVFFLGNTITAQESQLKKGVLERMVQPKLTINSSYLSDANVEDSSGSVQVAKNSIRLNNAIGGVSYTNWSFLWNNIASLPFGDGTKDPIKHMHKFKANLNIPYFASDKWFVLTSLSINSTFEKQTQDSYGAGLFSFASYKLDEDHSFQMGAFANYHPISTLALPVVSYSYRARKNNGLQVVLGFPRAYAGYYLNDTLLLRSGFIYSQSVIKLSDSSSISQAGYIEAKDYMGSFGLVYEATENFVIDGDILYSIKRDFTIYNHSGVEEDTYSIKPSLGVSLRLKYLF